MFIHALENIGSIDAESLKIPQLKIGDRTEVSEHVGQLMIGLNKTPANAAPVGVSFFPPAGAAAQKKGTHDAK